MSEAAANPGRFRRLLPLVLATTATQASIVVLAPLLVEIGRSLGASVSAVGVARSVLAGTAFAGSLAIGPLIDRIGVRPLIVRGGALALAGAAATAASPTLAIFYAAHVVTGLGVACLLSAGFAGVASYFSGREMAWAMGYVVGAQSLAWIVGNPIVGTLAEAGSWRLAYVVPASVCLAALVAGLALRPGAARGAARSPEPDEPIAAAPPESIGDGLRAVFGDRSARRWTISELVAYSAWSAELTYAAVFYIRNYDTGLGTIGFLLAGGSLVFLLTSLSTARLTTRFTRKPLLVACAFGMGAMLVPMLNWAPSAAGTFAMFCAMAVFAGIRLAGSSSLGLDQLPDRPGAMMGARTSAAQLGYMIGAAGGGLVLALWGFGTLGFVLFAGMALSALLLTGVHDPWSERQRAGAVDPLPAPLVD
ncbi:MAG: MFS transporter [Actinomycetota bacterium]|nr:MFS transporter [Actinomycetota bacterium]